MFPCVLQTKEAFVTAYKRLRTEDAAPGSNTAYRITVRQLEALVRLSEAMARLKCRNTVLATDVAEVRRCSSLFACAATPFWLHVLADNMWLAGAVQGLARQLSYRTATPNLRSK